MIYSRESSTLGPPAAQEQAHLLGLLAGPGQAEHALQVHLVADVLQRLGGVLKLQGRQRWQLSRGGRGRMF